MNREHVAALLDALTSVSIAGVGFALGGPIGKEVLAVGLSIGTDLTKQAAQALRDRFIESQNGLLNHDLQRVLAQAVDEALRAIEREGVRYWKASRFARQTIRDFCRDLRKKADEVFLTKIRSMTEEDALAELKTYVYGSPEQAEKRLLDTLEVDVTGAGLPKGFPTFFSKRLPDEVVFRFGEELKKDAPLNNRAWRAFQRLLLESTQAATLQIGKVQQEITNQLDTIEQQLITLAEAQRSADPADPFLHAFEQAMDDWGTRIDEKLDELIAMTLKTFHAAERAAEASEQAAERVDAVHDEMLAQRQDLDDIMTRSGLSRTRLCFVTGPPARTARLIHTIVRPALDGLDRPYEVALSDGQVSMNDLSALEEADLVIADLTGHDPDVVYELACTQCLGRPDIVFIDEAEAGALPTVAFRAFPYSLDRPEEAQVLLQSTVLALDRAQRHATPITEFFRAPLTEVSPAYGLALGYVNNFVAPVGRLLANIRGGQGGYVRREIDPNDPESGAVVVDDPALMKEARLVLLIPAYLKRAYGWVVRNFFNQLGLPEVTLGHPESRPFTRLRLLSRPDEPVLIGDIPTTMSVIIKAIDERLGAKANEQARRALELREIEHFVGSIQRILTDQHKPDLLDTGIVDIKALNKHFPDVDSYFTDTD